MHDDLSFFIIITALKVMSYYVITAGRGVLKITTFFNYKLFISGSNFQYDNILILFPPVGSLPVFDISTCYARPKN